MRQSTRIVINTLATYGRSVLAMVLGLFSARWILRALGEVDFGLFGVVGSIIMLMTFLQGGLIVGVARFYAFAIGKSQKDCEEEAEDELRRWFNTALSAHLLLPIILIGIGWPTGEYAISHWLTIPPDRIAACLWVFRISMLSALVGTLAVPFTAMYTARQLIYEVAVFDLFRSVATFLAAWVLLRLQSDRLIGYAWMMMGVNVGSQLIQVGRAVVKFKACRPKASYMFERRYLHELFGYVGWKTFGMGCVAFSDQGTPVLANLHFGPVVNAAYSVASRLSIQASSLSSAMMAALQPALTTVEGKGERERMLNMATQASKFSTLLILLFVIPLILEMDSLLVLWLVNPPQYAEELCRWMLAILVVDKMTSGAMMAVNAHGRIARYELVQGTAIILALPLMWVLFQFGIGPIAIGVALFASKLAYFSGRLYFARRLVQLPICVWTKRVVMPVSIVCSVGLATGGVSMTFLEAGFARICLTSLATVASIAGVGWVCIFDRTERDFAVGMLRRVAVRLKIAGSSV